MNAAAKGRDWGQDWRHDVDGTPRRYAAAARLSSAAKTVVDDQAIRRRRQGPDTWPED